MATSDSGRDFPVTEPAVDEQQAALIAQIQHLLEGVLGAHVWQDSALSRWGPVRAGFWAAASMGMLCVGAEWWLGAPDYLLALAVWGTFYFGVVVALSRMTDRALQAVLPALIRDHYPGPVAERVSQDLDTRVDRQTIINVSAVAAAVFIMMSLVILRTAGSLP